MKFEFAAIKKKLIRLGICLVALLILLSISSLAKLSLNQFISIFHIFCMGIGMGASVLVARYYGMKDKESLKAILSTMATGA